MAPASAAPGISKGAMPIKKRMDIITFIFLVIFLAFSRDSASNEKNVITAFTLLFLIEIFPFKTTGSFFTTGNSTYIFLLIAVIVGFSNKLIYYKKKQI